MLVQAFGACAARGIPMEAGAAQASVHNAPAPRADITRPIQIHTIHPLAKKRGAPMPPSKV